VWDSSQTKNRRRGEDEGKKGVSRKHISGTDEITLRSARSESEGCAWVGGGERKVGERLRGGETKDRPIFHQTHPSYGNRVKMQGKEADSVSRYKLKEGQHGQIVSCHEQPGGQERD